MMWQGGQSGIRTPIEAVHRNIFSGGFGELFVPGGRTISSVSRDPQNTGAIDLLRSGLLMGKRTADSQYAPSAMGQNTVAVTSTATTITVSAATATELVRRVGSSGSFKLTGPPTAAGTIRTLTVTYSAVNTTTGVITVTALGVNEVQTLNLTTAATAGNLRLIVPKPDGTLAITNNAAWNATDATYIAAVNTVLDAATGVAGGIVASAIPATDTDLGFVFTFSGTGYANLAGPTTGGSWPLIQVHTFPTSVTIANTVRTTAGVDGRFVSGSLVQPTDGSETPMFPIPCGFGVKMTEMDGTVINQPFPQMPLGGVLLTDNIIAGGAYSGLDSSIKSWIKDNIRSRSAGIWCFSDAF